jgi:hypothetical protein
MNRQRDATSEFRDVSFALAFLTLRRYVTIFSFILHATRDAK